MIIGIDFDNTIACYDHAFSFAAHDMGLLPDETGGDKAQIKARVLAGAGGEKAWMKLQGRVYGYYIGLAEMFPGFAAFVLAARAKGHQLKIISHKSQFGHFDPDHIDLTVAARGWMREQGFFERSGLGFDLDDVAFYPVRSAKLEAIARRRCDVFIDDLPEIFSNPGFPDTARKFLFSPGGLPPADGLCVCRTWQDLEMAILA
jgi:hypothetical protein